MMPISKSIKYISIALAAMSMASCQSDYTSMVKKELAKGVRQDSLLLGVKFGDDRENFYGRCFDLNRAKIVTQGVGFSAQYMINDTMTQTPPREIAMLFYPKFDTANIINGLDIEFRYPGWNPGIRETQSDSLMAHVQKILLKWYKGNDFVMANINDKETPVKVDGNRRIMMKIEDEQRVLVHVHDLLHPMYRHKDVYVNEEMERKSK
jgi:hypothetical protein